MKQGLTLLEVLARAMTHGRCQVEGESHPTNFAALDATLTTAFGSVWILFHSSLRQYSESLAWKAGGFLNPKGLESWRQHRSRPFSMSISMGLSLARKLKDPLLLAPFWQECLRLLGVRSFMTSVVLHGLTFWTYFARPRGLILGNLSNLAELILLLPAYKIDCKILQRRFNATTCLSEARIGI